MMRPFKRLAAVALVVVVPAIHAQGSGIAQPGSGTNPYISSASPAAQLLAHQGAVSQPTYDAATHTITMPNGIRISPTSAQNDASAAASVRSLTGTELPNVPVDAAQSMSENQPGFGGGDVATGGGWRPAGDRAQLVLSPDVYVVTDQAVVHVGVALIRGYGPVRVDYIVKASNLRNHEDFEAVSGTLYWPPGQSGSKYFDIPLNQSSIDAGGVAKGEIDFQIEDAAGAQIVGPSAGRVVIEKEKSPSIKLGACEIGGAQGCRGWIPAQALPQTGSSR